LKHGFALAAKPVRYPYQVSTSWIELLAAATALAATASAHKCDDECRNDSKQERKMNQKKSKNNRFHRFDLRGALRKGPDFLALIASQ
jgi:hypothetical protein